MASNSYSLDYLRKLFRSTNTNIFEVVENAVLVAATDYPMEFAHHRDELVERIFTCKLDHRSWCDRTHEVPSGKEETDEIEVEKRENKLGNDTSNVLGGMLSGTRPMNRPVAKVNVTFYCCWRLLSFPLTLCLLKLEQGFAMILKIVDNIRREAEGSPPKVKEKTASMRPFSTQIRPLEACNQLPEPHYYRENRRRETRRQNKPLEAPTPPKPYDEGKRRPQECSSAQQRPLEAHNRLPKLHDAERKNHKPIEDDSGPSIVPERPPRTAFEHKAGAETKIQHNQGLSQLPKRLPSIVQAAPQQYDDWFLAQEKLETAKRKLQEGYQQAEHAKRQRTLQVVELSNMPKHGQNRR
ncbi:putative mediator of RNA polymerase II transcription subunit 26a [Cocos nucifera]|uniref:Putative mediator of RNA polymerase II transcription subunit 26a n=1 Tax=Cocos nucifera TaxID=13894 RepID=A0A8K0N084_COCNU|nr:putative mediator of RNA polymerase II transcription subunit 26a [Cocos nucifera]